MSIPWKNFPKLRTSSDLEDYFAVRTSGHGRFYHYTSRNAINCILCQKEIRLSCVSRFNDTLDSKQFDGKEHLYYSFCLSSGVTENLSLWYLYSGQDGKGARLEFSKTLLKKFIDCSVFSLYEYDYDKNERRTKIAQLEDGVSMKKTLYDVLYNAPSYSCDCVRLKYNTMTNYHVSYSEFEKYQANHIGFFKPLIWYYEKETRFLIEIIGELSQKLDPNKSYAVVAKFDNALYHNLKICFGPELTDIESEISITEYPQIHKFIVDTSAASLSQYHGDIRMGLSKKISSNSVSCSNCKKGEEK